MPPAGPGIQSSKPEKVDASVTNVKGHDYYKDAFVPPEELVTEIDPRDKVGCLVLYISSLLASEVFAVRSCVTCNPYNTCTVGSKRRVVLSFAAR